ncbi:MAG: nucleoside hydrolase [Aerococcus sp.]|nr:nucleoside hydrolase [Aerococcus sp.]
MQERSLIIDTDTAGDDAIALLMALQSFHVEGVTICGGNVAFDQEVKNALFTLALAPTKTKVPVYRGCERPLLMAKDQQHETVEHIFGANGMGDVEVTLTVQQPETQHAVDFIIETAHRLAGELELIAIAPLTNIAMAIQKDPSIVSLIRHLYIMGGVNNALGNATAAAEYNFYTDPEAAKLVFQAGIPITLVDWQLCVTDGVMTPDDEAYITTPETQGTTFYQELNAVVKAYDMEVNGVAGITHTDALLAAVAGDPTLEVKGGDYFVDIETTGELTRGYSLIDVANYSKKPANAHVVEQIDHIRFREYVRTVLQQIVEV